MASPTQKTVQYHGSVPVAAEPERVRVVLVGGSCEPKPDDLYRLLRRRLLVVTTIASIYFTLSNIIMVHVFWRLSQSGDFERLIGLEKAIKIAVLLALSLVVTAGSCLVLWLRPPRSITGLRTVELFVVGVLVFLQLRDVVSPDTYGKLIRILAEPSETGQSLFAQYVYWQALVWFVIIVLYGTIIPNTLRRCVIVVGFLALSPLALYALYAFWVQPLLPRVASEALISWGIFQAIAVAVVVFSSSRIEHYRRQASAARKLGQYLLKEKLGSGGMGEVYRAEHILLRRPCALKTIRPEKAGDPNTLRRFEPGDGHGRHIGGYLEGKRCGRVVGIKGRLHSSVPCCGCYGNLGLTRVYILCQGMNCF